MHADLPHNEVLWFSSENYILVNDHNLPLTSHFCPFSSCFWYIEPSFSMGSFFHFMERFMCDNTENEEMIVAVNQFMQLRKEAWKKFRTSTGFEPVTLLYRCDALQTEL